MHRRVCLSTRSVEEFALDKFRVDAAPEELVPSAAGFRVVDEYLMFDQDYVPPHRKCTDVAMVRSPVFMIFQTPKLVVEGTFVAVRSHSDAPPYYYVIRLTTLRDGSYDYVEFEQKKTNGAWHAKSAVIRDQEWDTLIWLHWFAQLTQTKKVPVRNLRAIAISPSAWPRMRLSIDWNT